jgi:enamine deaminase RidA (YjgF/YER057c/UK114 family)
MNIERWPAGSPGRSRTVAAGPWIWTVANVSRPGVAFEEEVRDCLELLDRNLKEAGSDRTRLVSLQVILADIADRTAFDALWCEWIGTNPAHWPQRACFQAGLAPGLRVELVAVAVSAGWRDAPAEAGV